MSILDRWRNQHVPRVRLLWGVVDGRMPRGLLGVGDPNLRVIDGSWTMFPGRGFSTSFRNRLYRARLPEGADLSSDRWQLELDTRGRVVPLAPVPPKGAWDAVGMHTPSYIPPAAGHGPRIYYTVRATSRQCGPSSQYAIGLLEYRNGSWRREVHSEYWSSDSTALDHMGRIVIGKE